MIVACFDVGGTGVKSALIGQDKTLGNYREIPTPDSLEGLLDFMDQVIGQQTVSAISISFPGAINQAEGRIEGLSAVPYIHGVSWYDLLSHYAVPVFLENDANCVGLSELAINESVQNCACVVVGTGIGGALIINRQLVRGRKSYGGEFGYMMIKGMDFPIKNWSQLASTGSLVRRVQAHPNKKYQSLDGKEIFGLAAVGDPVCGKAIDTMVENICQGLLNLYYTFDPELIYIGGSISQNATFIQMVKEKLTHLQQVFPDDLPEIPEVQACTYTKDANLIGAYMNTLQGKETR